MVNRAEVREFLMSRRARVTPEAAGLRAGTNRRVAGLRRGEVATLAGVSIEYYSRLERGAIAGASASVLDAISNALQLDDTERAHLFDLARAADGVPTSSRPRRRATRQSTARPSLQWALAAITNGVAFVRNPRQDILATNDLGRAFYAPVIGDGGRTPNLARFQFLDPASHDFYPDWDLLAEMCVSIMRTEAGRDPHDKELQDLVGELSTRSETFRTLWAAHNVRTHGTGTKRFHHPLAGELTLRARQRREAARRQIDLRSGDRLSSRQPVLGDSYEPPSNASTSAGHNNNNNKADILQSLLISITMLDVGRCW